MSLAKANGSTHRSRTLHPWTQILEVLAFAIHPGSTESTTTLCHWAGTIYLTSQNNLTFDDVDASFLQNKLKALKNLVTNTSAVNERIEQWWADECVVSEVSATTATGYTKNIKTLNKERGKVADLHSRIYKPAMEEFLATPREELVESIKSLRRAIAVTVVVVNNAIFHSATETTGFHGESRILRYLFIVWATPLLTMRAEEWSDEANRPKMVEAFERNFIEAAAGMNLAFGSSQGTCLGCCRALDICRAARGKAGNPPKQWLDPLDMTGTQGGSVVGASASTSYRLHAMSMILR
ncbi:MAG TPA: hypothetical protein VN814_07740 [Caulobacteraceae bacterium]|nr:hypothetical protein [Caulobacteraceae bacterium]